MDVDTDLIVIQGINQTIERLSIVGPVEFNKLSGEGAGIRIKSDKVGSGVDTDIFGVHVRDVKISFCAGYGVHVDGTRNNSSNPENNFSVWGVYERVDVDSPGKGCVAIDSPSPATKTEASTTQYFKDCFFQGFNDSAVLATTANGLAFERCVFQAGLAGTPGNGGAIHLTETNQVVIVGCWFEDIPGTVIKATSNSGNYIGIAVRSCLFSSAGSSQTTYVEFAGTGKSIEVANLTIFESAKPSSGHHVVIGSSCEATVSGGGVVGGLGASQELDVGDQSSKSVLLGSMWRIRLPRLSASDVSAFSNWAAGDTIFNTSTGKAQIYDGSAWQSLW